MKKCEDFSVRGPLKIHYSNSGSKGVQKKKKKANSLRAKSNRKFYCLSAFPLLSQSTGGTKSFHQL